MKELTKFWNILYVKSEKKFAMKGLSPHGEFFFVFALDERAPSSESSIISNIYYINESDGIDLLRQDAPLLPRDLEALCGI